MRQKSVFLSLESLFLGKTKKYIQKNIVQKNEQLEDLEQICCKKQQKHLYFWWSIDF